MLEITPAIEQYCNERRSSVATAEHAHAVSLMIKGHAPSPRKLLSMSGVMMMFSLREKSRHQWLSMHCRCENR